MQQLKLKNCIRLTVVLWVSTVTWAEGPQHDFFVGAYYYPWHWLDFHGGGYLREHLVPPQLPELGEYNDRNASVLAQHISWASNAGVEFWVASWWGPGSREDVTLENHVFPHPQLGDLKIAIHYETDGRTNGFTSYSAIGPDITYIATTFFDHPNYLRIGGRPVIFVYLTRVLSQQGTLASTVTTMRNAASVAGHDIYIVGDHVFGSPPGTPGNIGLLDAVTNYDVYGSMGAFGYAGQSYVDNYYASQAGWRGLVHSTGTAFIPAVAPGFNDKGVRSGHAVLSRKLSAGGEFGSLFRAMLQGAKPLTDLSTQHMLMVTSWNEWHEDTQIEPVQAALPTSSDDSGSGAYTNGYAYEGYGTRYLDLIEEETVVIDYAGLYGTIYVDFLLGDDQNAGTGVDNPLRTLSTACDVVTSGGTVRIQAGTTDETIQITKAMTLEAIGGTVRVGASGGAKSRPVTFAGRGLATNDSTSAAEPGAENTRFLEFLRALIGASIEALADGLSWGEDEAESAEPKDGQVHEPVLPFTKVNESLHTAQTESVLAVRLRSDAEIDPESIWASVPESYEERTTMDWRPVQEGELRDIWVICRPQETWQLKDVISLTVGAATVEGEPIGPVTYEFQVETEEEYEARINERREEIWQPQYNEDFIADELDLTTESNGSAAVRPSDEETPSLSVGIEVPFTIDPQRVYDTPQRVWLPLPQGIDRADVQLYYYHPHGADAGWYPAEDVEGWLVPDSYLHLRLNSTTYLGFVVRHGAIVQLGVPVESNE